MARIRLNTITCEHPDCSTQVVDNAHEQAYSMLVVLQKVDTTGYQFYQCDKGSEVDFHNWQHWHCSHNHMKEGVKRCINEHHREHMLRSMLSARGTSNLYRMVLGSSLLCKICQAPIKDQAYRFCLTYATPINFVPDNSDDELEGWCCSYAHAIDSVVATLDAL